MKTIRNTQWLIAVSVLSYGVAAGNSWGTLIVIFFVFGLLLCGLASWVWRLTVIPVFFAAIVDCWLAFISWSLFTGELQSIQENANYQNLKLNYIHFFTIDSIASFTIFSLSLIYITASALNIKKFLNNK